MKLLIILSGRLLLFSSLLGQNIFLSTIFGCIYKDKENYRLLFFEELT